MNASSPIRVAQIMGHMAVGGVESTIMNHYRALDRTKVTFDFIVDDDSKKVPEDEIRALGGRVFRIPKVGLLHLPQYDAALSEVLTEIHPDIVHSNINSLSFFPLRVAKKNGVKIRIAHNHSMSNRKELIRDAAKNMLRPVSRVYPNALAACTETAGAWLFGKNAVRKGRVHIIKNAIDVRQYAFSARPRQALRRQYDLDDKFVVGQVGRLASQKNYLFSVEVFAKILKRQPNAVFIMLGEGNQRAEIEQRIRDLGIGHAVFLLGNQLNVNEWNSAFDVQLFPSLYEGAGMTAIEAQTAMLPVVASDRVPSETFLEKDLITVLSLQESPEVWADAVLRAGHQGIDRLQSRSTLKDHGYDIEDSAQQLQTWYESLMASLG